MKEKMALLIFFIDKQWKVIDELSDKISEIIISMKRETLREEYIVYAAYTLHNIYCAFEDIFKNVAMTFENQINDFSKYHLELLKKMSLSVYKIRPQFL
ncbi:MAG: hypothetical protein SVR08_14410 [Spirochaetota bacterium]|nr:hypothetical protein [Spirochaetota bacterium]